MEDFDNILDIDDQDIIALDALECESSLSYFIKRSWPILEPSNEYMHNWHVDAIAQHLEAITRGEIRNLIINMPPRCAKSLIVAVFWPCWVWTTQPGKRWIFASYAQSLSMRDSLKCRRLMDSKFYQDRWGGVFSLASDQNTKTRFENSKSGFRQSTSTDSAATGEGGDFVVVDDPMNAKDTHSEAVIRSTKDWWDLVMSTRYVDPRTVAKVIVMQRLGEDDLSGHVLKQGGYEHLILPMEYDKEYHCKTNIGWEDPRKDNGELLWGSRFGTEELEKAQKVLGTYGYAGQMQQRPAPKGGGMFKIHWFDPVHAVPVSGRRVRYWDRAATVEKNGNDPDYTVGVKLCRDADNVLYIEDIVRMRASSLEVQKTIVATAKSDGFRCRIGLEQDPGSAGKSEVEYLIRQLQGFVATPYKVSKDKITRASPASAQAEAGNIKMLIANWNQDFLNEIAGFPFGKHDDIIDALSGAFEMQVNRGLDYASFVKM